MEISIPYGDSHITLKVDSKNIEIAHPRDVRSIDEEKAIISALKNPTGSVAFYDFIRNAKDILFVVNDATRPTPTAKILRIIMPHIKDKNIKFLVATGAHRAPTEKEYRYIFKEFYETLKGKISAHNSREKDDAVYIGKTSRRTDVFINKMVIEADSIVPISSVEPHYFAGYTGGRKSFLPGVTHFDTIEQNHKHALSPDAKPLALQGNPVHEDMREAMNMLKSKKIFSIQTVLNKEHSIYAVFGGDINQTFELAVLKANEVFTVTIEEKADIVISVVRPPMDIDLYQSQKGIENTKSALKKGGIMILVSQCKQGIGDNTFFKLLSTSSTPSDVVKKVEREYILGYHKASKIAQLCLESEIWALTSIKDEDLKSIFIKPIHSLQNAIETAVKLKGPNARILIVLDGSLCVPVMEVTQ